MRKFILFLFICSLSIIGCEDSSNVINTPQGVDGLSLLGLADGRTMVYIQTDTVINPETYGITITDTILSILITGSDNDWIIHKDAEKLINLKVGSSSIIQNGYWKKLTAKIHCFIMLHHHFYWSELYPLSFHGITTLHFMLQMRFLCICLFIMQILDIKFKRNISVLKL